MSGTIDRCYDCEKPFESVVPLPLADGFTYCGECAPKHTAELTTTPTQAQAEPGEGDSQAEADASYAASAEHSLRQVALDRDHWRAEAERLRGLIVELWDASADRRAVQDEFDELVQRISYAETRKCNAWEAARLIHRATTTPPAASAAEGSEG